jgi:hypothetical protein
MLCYEQKPKLKGSNLSENRHFHPRRPVLDTGLGFSVRRELHYKAG